MEILLINPHGGHSWQEVYSDSSKHYYMFPYSLVYLQNFLAKAGIETKLFDLFQTAEDNLLKYCTQIRSPVIGFTAQAYNRDSAIATMRRVKNVCPTSRIVFGGKHFSYCAQDALEHLPEIDFIVRDEGEHTFLELVRQLESNDSPEGINGISYRCNGEIIHNPRRRLERNLDLFSLDYDMLPTDDFKKGIMLRNFQREQVHSLPVLAGRGCSSKCAFCSYNKIKYRSRSLDDIVREISYLKRRFGYRHFTFTGPSFCERSEVITAFCERILEDKLEINWYCETRVDTPLETLELMARAGCVSCDFGVESGSEKVLRAINKDIEIPQAINFAKECNKLGIRSLVFFMISLPDETESEAQQTLEVAKQIAEYAANCTLAVTVILPGTRLEEMAKERGLLPRNFSYFERRFYHNYSDLAHESVPLYLEHLSVEFIRKFKKSFEQLKYTQYLTFRDCVNQMRRGIVRIGRVPLRVTVHDSLRFFRGIKGRIMTKVYKR